VTTQELIDELKKFDSDLLVMWQNGDQIHVVESDFGVVFLRQLPKLSKSAQS
jgi:hypothetical protein